MRLRSEIILDAKLIMRDGLARCRPGAVIDGKGYVDDWRLNLLPGIDPSLIEGDFRRGKGSELDSKFCAAHSSAALAVNVFGPFRDGVQPFPIPGIGELTLQQFERTFPTGLPNRIPPHLDVAASGPDGVVAIESKCLEYLTPKAAKFPPAYQSLDASRETGWYAEMERLRSRADEYRLLDAAQLIKQAFGLIHAGGSAPTLVYLFWEPDDAAQHAVFAAHRAEIATFSDRVAGCRVKFVAMSYPALWAAWSTSTVPRLRQHAGSLSTRYGGALGSYEGYSRVGGRKTDVEFLVNV